MTKKCSGRGGHESGGEALTGDIGDKNIEDSGILQNKIVKVATYGASRQCRRGELEGLEAWVSLWQKALLNLCGKRDVVRQLPLARHFVLQRMLLGKVLADLVTEACDHIDKAGVVLDLPPAQEDGYAVHLRAAHDWCTDGGSNSGILIVLPQ